MNMMCSNKTIKYLMFIFNFIFVLTGIIILAVGVSVKAHYYPYDTFLDNKYFSLPNMLIATGSLIFFISFLGCYGAMRENWIMLMGFSVLLAIIFIFELSVGIAGYVLKDKTSAYLESKLSEMRNDYNKSSAIRNMWDVIQEEFQCCGISGPADWNATFGNYSLPVSCCPSVSSVGAFYCNSYNTEATTTVTTPSTSVTTESTTPATTPSSTTVDPAPKPDNDTTQASAHLQSASQVKDDSSSTAYPPSSSNPYTTGCQAAFGSFIKAHAVDIGGVGIALAVIQLVGIAFSFHLARQLKNGYYST